MLLTLPSRFCGLLILVVSATPTGARRSGFGRRSDAVYFDPLDDPVDNLPYGRNTCEHANDMTFPTYHEVDKVSSPYQEIGFDWDPDTNDTCFKLDRITQICACYRPHYHELSVHYPARFLDQVKRVLWVGGGDSMLLHEVIKYPSLEFVVGLEIDQTVTRLSFKHFGTQPHWDNPKVQWWYGDAAKSMQMLPKEYYGSFDLVLVDLSETVMSNTVTQELDIMGALALLLNKNGILVKNEILYLETMAEIFEYSIQVNYYDVPIICDQSLIMGSYGTDFFHRQNKDHNVPVQWPDHFPSLADQGGVAGPNLAPVHDYTHNPFNDKLCTDDGESLLDAIPDQQDSSPGIVLILETENANLPSNLEETLQAKIQEADFHVRSTATKTNGDSMILALVLEEGYVMARTWPEHSYCAFDIHLWSNFDKLDAIKQALVTAVGADSSTTVSAYRIVTGGMFGVSTWKEDLANRGPRSQWECEELEESNRGDMDSSTISQIMKESLSMIFQKSEREAAAEQTEAIAVLVVCGKEESESCQSLDVVQKDARVGKVVPFYTCGDLPSYIDETNELEGAACMDQLNLLLDEQIDGISRIRGIVLDPTMPHSMGQVVHKVFSSWLSDRWISPDDLTVLSPMSSDEDDEWRLVLLDQFRTSVVRDDPVFLTQTHFNSTSSNVQMLVTSSGDKAFSARWNGVVAKIQQETGLEPDIRIVKGGLFNLQQEPFVPTYFFPPSDYDQRSPLKQWKEQKPLAAQTIFQFEVASKLEMGEKIRARYDAEDPWMSGTVAQVNWDGTFDIFFENGDREPHLPRHMIQKVETDDGESAAINTGRIMTALRTALHTTSLDTTMRDADIQVFDELGDGVLFLALWEGGSVLVQWDGRIHVDMNLFTYVEKSKLHEELKLKFMAELPMLVPTLHDQHPRGIGRVVNFEKDLGSAGSKRPVPSWATHLSEEEGEESSAAASGNDEL